MLYEEFMNIYLPFLVCSFTDNSADFNNSVIWNWDDVALNVYKSVLPLQEQNNNIDEGRGTELPIPNSHTSESQTRNL